MSKARQVLGQLFPPLLVGFVYLWLFFSLTDQLQRVEDRVQRLEDLLVEHEKGDK